MPVFTWTGAYFGINAGYAFDASSRSTGNSSFGVPGRPHGQRRPGTVATFRNNSQDGFSGGAQVGYNYQFTPGNGRGRRHRGRRPVPRLRPQPEQLLHLRPARSPPAYYVTDPRGLSSLDYFGTVRGRLGYAFDRTLVYGTGGFAYGSGSADRSFGGYAGNDSFRTGYAVGGGIEYALPTDSFLNFFRSSAVTLKVEGLYVNLDRNTRNQGAFVINAANNFPVVTSGGRSPLRRVRRRPRRPELQVRLVLRTGLIGAVSDRAGPSGHCVI